MRPVAQKQDPFRYPLDEVLGTVANVRVLRVLVMEGALSHRALAKTARLNEQATRNAAARLEALGVLRIAGSGRGKTVGLREDSRLNDIIQDLFVAEQRAAEDLFKALHTAIKHLRPPPLGAWITRQSGNAFSPGMTIELCLLGESRTIEKHLRALEKSLPAIESAHDVLIELRGITKADLVAMTDEERNSISARPHLYGLGPEGTVAVKRETRSSSSHAAHDAMSLEAGCAMAQVIKDRPGIVARARDEVDRLLEVADERHARELREWHRILARSDAAVRAVLRDPGERGTRLRQSNPFYAVLRPNERDQVRRRQSLGGGKS